MFDGYLLSHKQDEGYIVIKYETEDEFYYLVGKLSHSRDKSLKSLAEKLLNDLKIIKLGDDNK